MSLRACTIGRQAVDQESGASMVKRSTGSATRTVDGTSAAPAPERKTSEPGGGERDTRRERIATAAYYRAERRNFQGDAALDDWLEAEREIDSAAAAAGIQGEASKLSEGPSDIAAAAMRERAADGDPDLIDPGDVHQWAEKLAVSAATLRVAIERAGARVSDVRRYLAQHDQGER